MKEITFVRHAKSSWKYDVSDKERPLKKRGITDADLVSSNFVALKKVPKHWFSSPANRALTTCKIFAKKAGFPTEDIRIDEKLYDFGGSGVVQFIKELDDDLDKIVIFGHNHAFTAIANSFGTEYIDNVPTCGLVTIQFDISSWKDLKQGKTTQIIFPRHLK